MLYDLQFVTNHPVYRLNEAVGHFLEHGLNRNAFNAQCYPAWFEPVVAALPGLKQRMRKVFRLARGKRQSARDSIFRVWKGIDDVQRLCDSTGTQLQTWGFNDGALCSALADLFDFLYEEVLNKSATLNATIGSSLQQHYEAFIALGQIVCPFCGLANYVDPQSGSRSSFDHFLPRKYYPLGAVNFRNLVPMCDGCNEPPGKGTQDVLFSDKHRTRRRKFFYPFGTNGGINLTTECTKRPAPGNLGAWKVRAKAKRNAKRVQVKGWATVFGIDTRFPARIRQGVRDWVKDFLNTKQYPRRPTVNRLRRDLAGKAIWLSHPDQVRTIAEAALRAAAFRYLAEKAPADMLEGYAAMATSAAVVGIPTAFSRN